MVSGGFDDIKSRDLRFLEESAKLGELTVLLWPDTTLQRINGKVPKFSLAERHYFLNAVRYVGNVVEADAAADFNSLAKNLHADIWADCETTMNPARAAFAAASNIAYRVFTVDDLNGFPEPPPMPSTPGKRKVVATGCYDWFHSGHVRFTEEASAYGDLYVCLGSDANVRLWKGDGHPLLPEEERRYIVGSIKFVNQALITTGSGWVDADPEIRRLKPDIYVVNEDGDKGGQCEYCAEMGMDISFSNAGPRQACPNAAAPI